MLLESAPRESQPHSRRHPASDQYATPSEQQPHNSSSRDCLRARKKGADFHQRTAGCTGGVDCYARLGFSYGVTSVPVDLGWQRPFSLVSELDPHLRHRNQHRPHAFVPHGFRALAAVRSLLPILAWRDKTTHGSPSPGWDHARMWGELERRQGSVWGRSAMPATSQTPRNIQSVAPGSTRFRKGLPTGLWRASRDSRESAGAFCWLPTYRLTAQSESTGLSGSRCAFGRSQPGVPVGVSPQSSRITRSTRAKGERGPHARASASASKSRDSS